MLDFIIGGERAGTGDDIETRGEGALAQLGKEEAGSGTVIILHRINTGTQSLQGLVEGDQPVGGDGAEKTPFFPSGRLGQGTEFPGRDTGRTADGFGFVGTFRGDAGAVPNQRGRRAQKFAAAGVHGFVGVGGSDDGRSLAVEESGVHTACQRDDLFHRSPVGRFDDMRGGTVQDAHLHGGEKHPVERVRVGRAADDLRLLPQVSQLIQHGPHQGRFSRARPAFDEIGLPSVLGVVQVVYVSHKAPRRIGPQKETDRRVNSRHGHPSSVLFGRRPRYRLRLLAPTDMVFRKGKWVTALLEILSSSSG